MANPLNKIADDVAAFLGERNTGNANIFQKPDIPFDLNEVYQLFFVKKSPKVNKNSKPNLRSAITVKKFQEMLGGYVAFPIRFLHILIFVWIWVLVSNIVCVFIRSRLQKQKEFIFFQNIFTTIIFIRLPVNTTPFSFI